MRKPSIYHFLAIFTLAALVAAGPAESRNSLFFWQKPANTAVQKPSLPNRSQNQDKSQSWSSYLFGWGSKSSGTTKKTNEVKLFNTEKARTPRTRGVSDYEPHSMEEIMKQTEILRGPHMAALERMQAATRQNLARLDERQRLDAMERQSFERQSFERQADEEPAPVQSQKKVIYNRPGLKKPPKVFTDYR